MPPKRAKPPVQMRGDLIQAIKDGLQGVGKDDAVALLLSYFTSVDMVQILEELPSITESIRAAAPRTPTPPQG